jgi:histidinol-phosphate phosphatase family protein
VRPCLFLDRDGVINVAAEPGRYIERWEQFRLIPQVVEWIKLCNELGLLVIVVTNQRGVALGRMSEHELGEIHENMLRELEQLGAHVDDVFYCPHQEGECQCRKPRTGMVRAAARKWDIDLSRSILVGDSSSDRKVAEQLGMRFVPVKDGSVTIADCPSVPG